MARARRKAPRQEAPQTLQDATGLAARYVDLLDRIDAERTSAQVSIDAIAAARDAQVGPLEEELKTIFRQLRPWWAANKEVITEGKRKSIELAGAQIGERTTTPALTMPKGMKLNEFVDWLVEHELDALIRTKHSADKPSCIKALRSIEGPEPDVFEPDSSVFAFTLLRALGEQIAEIGVTVTQKDEFFIDRAGRRDEATKIVDVETEGGAE